MGSEDRGAGEDLAALVALASGLAARAGGLLSEASGRGAGARWSAATTKSSPTDLVTELDRRSEALIVEGLLQARPGDAVLGEEGGPRAGSSGRCWVIDPLDGTTNFVYGYGSYAVSIALTDEAGSVVGVVHDPVRGETFTAARGLGAKLNGTPLVLGERRPELAEALLGTGFAYGQEARAAQGALLPHLLPRVRDLRRGGAAALDLCFVAAGRLDGYFEAGLQPWDRAAGLLIAIEAGALHEDLDDLVPGHETLVVAPPTLLPSLVGLLLEADARSQGTAATN